MSYLAEITGKVKRVRSRSEELALGWQKRHFCGVQQRLSLHSTKIGPGTIAAALAALSMAVLGHFFI
jgi:hypothetical protein